jgi:hypothetical protein
MRLHDAENIRNNTKAASLYDADAFSLSFFLLRTPATLPFPSLFVHVCLFNYQFIRICPSPKIIN